jgi:N-acetylglucosaminyldiphosphoundecaprenol N-acetyl-beta-D-mannosaminyltransferase
VGVGEATSRGDGAGSTDGPASYRVLGVPVAAVTDTDLVALVAAAVGTGDQQIILSQNLHGVHTYLHDPAYRRLHERPETTIHIDGTPLLWAARLRKLPLRSEHRTGVIDWIHPLLSEASEEGWRVYHLGGDESELSAGLGVVRERYPGIKSAGHQGFFDTTPGSPASQVVLEDIREFRPDLLLLGMGMGRQERWILHNSHLVEAPAIVTVGSVMKLLSGELRTPPRWTGRFGVEWLFRFVQQPRTTFRRYFVEPWQIAWRLTQQRISLRL